MQLYIYTALYKLTQANTQIRVMDSMLCLTKRDTKKALMEQGFLTEGETLLGCFGCSSINCQNTSHYLKKRIQALCDDSIPPNTHSVLAQVVFWSGTYLQHFFGTSNAPHTYRAVQQVKQVTIISKCSL